MTSMNIQNRPTTQVLISEPALQQMQAELARRQVDMERLKTALETLAAVNEAHRFTAACMALCNQLASRWVCERVAVGFLKGRYVRVKGLSHTEKFSSKMRLVQDIEAAMEECLDQDVEILSPPAAQATYVSRAAELLSSHHGPMTICALPLRRNAEVVAVLLLERKPDKPFSLEEIETLRLVGDLVTSRLQDLYEYDRWFGARLAADTRKGLGVLVGPTHTWAKVIALAIFLGTVFLIFGKGMYHVESPFTLAATEKRIIPAPYNNGYLKTVEVDVGQEVKAGQVLATLETSELKVKLAEANAERQAYLKQAEIARRDKKEAEAQMAEKQAEKSEAEAKMWQLQIEKSTIRSEVDGVVLSGDLKQKIGAPVSQGDVLFEVGPLAKIHADLQIPEEDIVDIKKGQTGELATSADPTRTLKFVVEQIDPVAQVVNQHNVFKVRVLLDEKPGTLRPGMEGVAHTDVEKRRYVWIWTHRLVNWVRMKLWF